MGVHGKIWAAPIVAAALTLVRSTSCPAQADPAAEPAVLAVAKVLPAVVNINTERVIRRSVRDPIEDFYAQFFGYYQGRPREIRQTLQSLGSGFIVDPAGYIVTNQHVVARAADLKIQVTTNNGKTYNAHYVTGDDKTDLAFIKIDSKDSFPFINLDNISPNLLGETVLVVGLRQLDQSRRVERDQARHQYRKHGLQKPGANRRGD